MWLESTHPAPQVVLFESALASTPRGVRDPAGRTPLCHMVALSSSLLAKLAKFLLYADGGEARAAHDFGYLLDEWPQLPSGLRAWQRHAGARAPWASRVRVADLAAALAPAQLVSHLAHGPPSTRRPAVSAWGRTRATSTRRA